MVKNMSNCTQGCGCNCQSSTTVPKELSNIFEKYKNKRENIIPLLQDVQEKYGYLNEENIVFISKHLDVPASKIFGVATFYNQFRLKPVCKNIIIFCIGTACHVKGSDKILEKLQAELNIEAGETTKDGLFTLETVACVGACSIAPVITIDEDFFGRLTTEDINSLLFEKYKKD